MFDLSNFKLRDMVRCAAVLREMGEGDPPLGLVAERTVRYLHESCGDASGRQACPLVRFFKTHRYAALDPELRAYVSRLPNAGDPSASTPCLTLLGTAGELPAWNSPDRSVGHRVIPLPSAQIVERFPMISQLIRQLGVEVSSILRSDRSLLVEPETETYGVFHVPDALGSPHIPAQDDFVRPFAIRSVLGFGGLLPDGELFAVILFSRVRIPVETARLFSTVALSVKVAVLGAADAPLFGVRHDS